MDWDTKINTIYMDCKVQKNSLIILRYNFFNRFYITNIQVRAQQGENKTPWKIQTRHAQRLCGIDFVTVGFPAIVNALKEAFKKSHRVNKTSVQSALMPSIFIFVGQFSYGYAFLFTSHNRPSCECPHSIVRISISCGAAYRFTFFTEEVFALRGAKLKRVPTPADKFVLQQCSASL